MRNCLCLCLPALGAVVGLVMLVAGVVVIFVVVPPILEREIIQSVVLNESSTEQFERWETLPVPLIFKVYFFNVTNVPEVQNGSLANVVEVGPYIYRQYREKYNIQRDGDTLSYNERQIFHFDQVLSGSLTEDDEVTIVHASMNGVLQQAEVMFPILLPIVNTALNNIFSGPTSMFLTTSVREVLFDGVPLCVNPNPLGNIVCSNIRSAAPATMRLAAGNSLLFSFFHHKNNTNVGLFKINDGSQNIADLGKILSWNNLTRLTLWEETENQDSRCNAINGTDSSIFAPFIDSDYVDVFNVDVCRSVTIHYEGKGSYEGISGRRYVNGPLMLSADEYECFCVENRECLKNGVMDLYPCQGADVMMSLPHFLYADEEYLNNVTGLQPNKAMHETFALLEPNSGTPLQGAARVQFNMFLREVPSIVLTQNLSRSLVPMLWVEEGVDLPEEYVDELYDKLISNLILIQTLKLVSLILGSLLVFICTILTVVIYFKCLMPRHKVY